MSIFGVDYSQGYSLATLQKYNVKFAVRYVGYTAPGLPQTKILTKNEAVDLTNSGIAIVSNWEWYNERPKEGFIAGTWDAITADMFHKSCGGPPDRPIYFSVDYNTDGSDTVQYFKGIASKIGLQRVGAYGSYDCIKYLYENNLIKWCWQTYAWSGGEFYLHNHLYQYVNAQTLDNMVVDFNKAYPPDFGQWMIGGKSPYMEQQFNDIWGSVTNGYYSGISKIVRKAFYSKAIGIVFPTSSEIKTVDLNGNTVLYQSLSNGDYIMYANGSGTIYSNNAAIYTGNIT